MPSSPSWCVEPPPPPAAPCANGRRGQAYLCDNDDQFTIPGWSLGLSWFLSLAAAIGFLLAAVGIAVSAFVLPPEEGYEFLEDPLDA